MKTWPRRLYREKGNCRYCGNPATVGPSGGLSQCDACREKHKKYYTPEKLEASKKRGKDQRLAIIEKYGGCCADCGYQGNPAAFEFHHINGQPEGREKSFKSRLYREEVDPNVVLLCANCHLIRHHGQLFD